jgi:curved DNA-binding protein CbpA
MTKKTDYYSILQVSPQATSEDIKMSFRRLARQYHPDLNPDDPETAEHFKQVSEAYEILSDEVKRRRYDSDRNLRTKQKQNVYSHYKSSNAYDNPTPEAGNAQDFFLRGMSKSRSKEYQKAIKEYTKAIELDRGFIDAYLIRES